MRCPGLDALPPPPAGRSGWPWTEQTAALPPATRDGNPWPRISMVVASLNHSAFIEEMLRSALLQGYPDLELIVIDGGSGAATLDVIKKYSPWLTYWVSEPDRGQSHAINKGMARVTGTIFNHFDTDDYLLPGALKTVAEWHAQHPDKIIAGDVVRTVEGDTRRELHRPIPHSLHAYAQWWDTEHHGGPGMFFPAAHLPAVGPVDESLHFLMDYEYTLRFLRVTSVVVPGAALAVIRHHDACKSVKDGDEFVWECVRIVRPYQAEFPDIAPRANREGAGVLFGFGVRRLLFGQGDAWRFIKEGMRIHPLWAIYWLVPGWFLRKWSRS
ncbi:MAG TPA: glycosyltransferase [Vicinamibacterales bacterium]|nr:glycosyltransferase [Vicinamibacterales bacterium]